MNYPSSKNTSGRWPRKTKCSEFLRQQKLEEEELNEPPREEKYIRGLYHWWIAEVADMTEFYQWLERAGLKDSTEALILVVQEQGLNIRGIEAQIYFTRQDPRIRLCNEAPETSKHLTAGCKIVSEKKYMECHNQVVGIVYKNICAEHKLET